MEMMNQSIWIGITVGVFFVGLAIGINVFSSTMNIGNMSMQNQQAMMQDPQFRQQMMNQFLDDPQMRNQMMESMTQDPTKMRSWMDSTDHLREMSTVMGQDNNFAMGMMSVIINDPALRLQMLGHMNENQDAMQQMIDMMNSEMMGSRSMMNSDMVIGNMTGGMMGSGMMNKDMMMQMMQDPETREKMIQIMSTHINEMQFLLSSELTGEEFNIQMTDLMQKHMGEMQDLMSKQSMHQSMK